MPKSTQTTVVGMITDAVTSCTHTLKHAAATHDVCMSIVSVCSHSVPGNKHHERKEWDFSNHICYGFLTDVVGGIIF